MYLNKTKNPPVLMGLSTPCRIAILHFLVLQSIHETRLWWNIGHHQKFCVRWNKEERWSPENSNHRKECLCTSPIHKYLLIGNQIIGRWFASCSGRSIAGRRSNKYHHFPVYPGGFPGSPATIQKNNILDLYNLYVPYKGISAQYGCTTNLIFLLGFFPIREFVSFV